MRRLLVVVLTFVAVGLGAPAAYACSCTQPPSFEDIAGSAEVAFTGEVTGTRGDDFAVRIDEVYRGSVPLTVTMRGEDPSSSCRIELRPGPFGYAGDSDLHVMGCQGGMLSGDSARTYAASHDGYAPDPSAPGPNRSNFRPVLFALLAASAATFAWRRRRGRRNAVA